MSRGQWVAAEAAARRSRRPARRCSGRLRLVARPFGLRLVLQRDREPDAVVHPALLWGLAELRRTSIYGQHHAWTEGCVSTATSRARREQARRGRIAAVSFHAYHLYIAPGLVRQRARAGHLHFIRIPWPMPDYARGRCWISIRRAIHEGLLASNVASFHTRRWSQSFCAPRGHPRRRARIRSRPRIRIGDHVTHVRCLISVDPHEFDEVAETDTVRGQESLIEAARPEFLVLRVDRTDLSKNVVRGFLPTSSLWTPIRRSLARPDARTRPVAKDIPEYAEISAPSSVRRGQRLACRARAGFPSTSRSRTTSCRRSPRTSSSTFLSGERDLRRDEPRGEGAPLVNTQRCARDLRVLADELGEWAPMNRSTSQGRPRRRRGRFLHGRRRAPPLPRGDRRARARQRHPRLDPGPAGPRRGAGTSSFSPVSDHLRNLPQDGVREHTDAPGDRSASSRTVRPVNTILDRFRAGLPPSLLRR